MSEETRIGVIGAGAWGTALAAAARRAGHMKQRGRYFLLLPKGAGAGGE